MIRFSVCMRRRKAKVPYSAPISVLPAMTVSPFRGPDHEALVADRGEIAAGDVPPHDL